MSWGSPFDLLAGYDCVTLYRSTGEISGTPATQELKLAVRKKSDGSYARITQTTIRELKEMGYTGVADIPKECIVED